MPLTDTVNSEATGTYIVLVVRLEPASRDTWKVRVYSEGTQAPRFIPLAPATFVIRLWHTSTSTALRGRIQLAGSPNKAPIQSNEQLGELVRAWLLRAGDTGSVS